MVAYLFAGIVALALIIFQPFWASREVIVIGFLVFVLFVAVIRSVRIVPARSVLVVERLGKFLRSLEAGFHLLVPFIDRVAYTHNLKEQAVDVPAQPCITQDNVKLEIDGVLYFQVVNPRAASYGILDYKYATIQLAQTTMRSVIGQLELDRTFEERELINGKIVASLDAASDPWGVKVTRYEIKDIKIPSSVNESMEYQVRAQRDKRAVIARSVGEMESRINRSIGKMEELINKSEGEKEKQINEAEGLAQEITALAKATATGLRQVAGAIDTNGGEDAVVLRIAEAYIEQLNKLSNVGTEVVLPLDLTDVKSVIRTLKDALRISD